MATASKSGTSTDAGTDVCITPGNGRPASVLTEPRAAEALERQTREVGRELFDRIGRGPRPWQRAWWDDRFMAATLEDPAVRIQLFRFIDALPALKTPESVRRHL